MPLIQKSFSSGKIIYLGLTKKAVSAKEFKPFSIRVNNKYCNAYQFSRFTTEFAEPSKVLSFAFIAAFKTSMQCLVQAKIPSGLMGLIHLNTYFEQIQSHNWLLPYDVEVMLKAIEQTDKGSLYRVTTRFYQANRLTLVNNNEYLDKNKDFKRKQPKTFKNQANLSVALTSTKISHLTGLRYARLSADYNPIHLSAMTAKLFGLKGAVIHGLYNCHWAITNLQKINGKPIKKIKIEFNKPCFLPSELELRQYLDTNNYGLFNKYKKEERFVNITL